MRQRFLAFAQSPNYPKFAAVVVFGALASILFLSLKPTSVNLLELDGFDKVQHTAAYFVLGLVTAMQVSGRRYILTLCAFWFMSGGIELIQATQPGRQGSVYDWIANLTGLLFAFMVVNWIKRVSN
ncbi:VanZ family protein [Vibrio mediterranei]|uniref:VanZ family protein n=1 Tax=Vibrio mediterranei TaxID=689 RepID=UPI00148BC783|nr:VanZ family protein [Vibrio mediterranei]NOH29045.1 hypothetical protein [Vibrio mediterranei]